MALACRRDLRRNDHLDELAIDDRLGGGSIEFAIDGDDAAKSRLGIGAVSAVIGIKKIVAEGDTAGVGMLDDDAGRPFAELFDAFEGGIGVADIVVRELFALQLTGRGDAGLSHFLLDIKGAALVGIFAVAQRLRLGKLQGQGRRIFAVFGTEFLAEPVGDGAVVGGGVLIDFDCQGKVAGATDRTAISRASPQGSARNRGDRR